MKRFTVLLSLMVLILVIAGPVVANTIPAPDPVTQSAPSAQDDAQTAEPTQAGTPQRGTAQEARDYEQRQEGSPEVQDFAGGFLGVVAVILLVILIVILVD